MLERRQPVRGEIVERDAYEVAKERTTFVHPISALVTISPDWFWTIPDLIGTIGVILLVGAVVAMFVVTSMTVTVIQL